ncbi:MAG: hypothetical protein HUU26_01830 [Gemmatimonadaceae bacterium]|nr:hypothetical protein [Gemmatimonadaceae bacterium]
MTSRTHALLALSAVLAVAACAGSSADVAPAASVQITATDYAFAVPATVPGGLVPVTFTNGGKEDHHAQIVRLNDGVTRDQFKEKLASVIQAAATEGEGAYMRLFEVASVAGGPGMVAPGRSLDTVSDLSPGEYALICFVAGPDGVPHVVKDMVQYFTVTAPANASTAAPAAAVSINLADFAFSDLPAFRTGRTTIEVSNGGPEPHEMIVLKLDGITLQQLMEMMSSPPPAPPPGAAPPPMPFSSVGGVQALMPGAKGWVTLDLTPGTYAMVCFIPSPANGGKPHVMLGMSKEFTVQ